MLVGFAKNRKHIPDPMCTHTLLILCQYSNPKNENEKETKEEKEKKKEKEKQRDEENQKDTEKEKYEEK